MNDPNTNQDRVIEVFNEAKARKAGQERERFLIDACASDDGLRAEVDQLLAADEAAEDFLGRGSGESSYATLELAGAEAGAQIGRYKLLQQIGEGGFGTVWMAEQVEPLTRRVALKIINPGMDTREVIARFEAERQALAMMDHPNIAKVFDAGTTGHGRPFFVMELVKGVPITQHCDEQRLGMRGRLMLFQDVCSAINHAHQKGVIHRDIKPSNVMVTMHGDTPVVKVIDFGIAKAVQGRLTDKTLFTRFEQFIGTPVYMSPEQATTSGLDIDTRSDIYGLGILLYELLTGKPPFDAKSLASAGYEEMRRIIREVEPPKPSSRLGTAAGEERSTLAAARHISPDKLSRLVEPDLDWIVMKAIEKDRTRRYETANGFALDIQRFLADEPVSARPPSRWYVLRKSVRRHKHIFAAAGAVAAALVAGLAVASWLYARERTARNGEAEQRKRAEAAAIEAMEQERVVAAVADFLQNDLLRQADAKAQAAALRASPGGFQPQANPTVRELLDRAAVGLAADKIDHRFPGQPLVQAMILKTVGETYMAIGSYTEALEFLNRADQLYEKSGDKTQKLRFANSAVLMNLGVALINLGRLPEAITLLERIRDASMDLKGPEHEDTLCAMHNLASAYAGSGRGSDAIQLLERVRDVRVATLGADHADSLVTLNNLAVEYGNAGRLPEQIKLLEDVRDAQIKARGEDHPDTIGALHNLASAYEASGRLPEAVPLMEQVLERQRQLLSADHPNTLAALNNLALAYEKTGQVPRAIQMLERLRESLSATLGLGHPQTLICLNNIGQIHMDAGNPNLALPLLEQAAKGFAALKFQHESAEPVIAGLVACLLALDRGEAAVAWENKWLAAAKERENGETESYTTALHQIGLHRLGRQHWKEAEPLLRECLAIFLKNQPDDWSTFETQYLIGACLMLQKRYAEAEQQLLSGYEGMKAREHSIPEAARARLPHAIEDIVELYRTTGQPQKAEAWQAKLGVTTDPQSPPPDARQPHPKRE